MRVILDGSEVYEKWGSSYRYFQALMPRLSRYSDVHLDLIPSPTNAFEEKPSGGTAKKTHRWLPNGKLRSWLGQQKKHFAKYRYLKQTASSEPTLYHSYYYSLPPNAEIPMVSVYLDTIPELFNKEFSAGYYEDLIRLKERTVRRSARILAISETTKNDLCNYYGISRSEVDVVYFGIDAAFFAEEPTAEASRAFRRQLQLPEHFFLYLGARSQHKNFRGWAEAYAKFAGRNDYAFVSAGMPLVGEEKEMLEKVGVKAHHIDLPDEPTLRGLYKAADIFVYPSLYEGMGLPPLEAMAAGVPVAAAKTGSIPEVSQDGAEYFDPRDPSSIHRALERCLEPARRAELLQKGRAVVRKYTWDEAAEKTVAAYHKVLG